MCVYLQPGGDVVALDDQRACGPPERVVHGGEVARKVTPHRVRGDVALCADFARVGDRLHQRGTGRRGVLKVVVGEARRVVRGPGEQPSTRLASSSSSSSSSLPRVLHRPVPCTNLARPRRGAETHRTSPRWLRVRRAGARAARAAGREPRARHRRRHAHRAAEPASEPQ